MARLCLFSIVAACVIAATFKTAETDAIGTELDETKVNPNGPGYKYLSDANNMKTQKITKLDWVGGNISINVAKVEWNGQPGFLKCMAEAANFIYEAKTFKVLEKADSLLKDAAKVYAPYIQHPLYSFKVPKTIEPHNTLCFIYTLANGVGSDVFLQKKSWEDKAIFLPQIMMQSIQGLMYLRYANLVHNDIIHDNILVEQIGGSKTIKATVVDYDLTRLIVDEKKSILETNNLTPLDKLNPLFASMLCRTENVKFVEKMYTSITGTPPPFEDKLRPGAYKALENIFRAIFDPLPGQTPDNIAKLIKEARTTYRYVPLDGTPLPDNLNDTPSYPSPSLDKNSANMLLKTITMMNSIYNNQDNVCLALIQAIDKNALIRRPITRTKSGMAVDWMRNSASNLLSKKQ